MAPRRRKRRYRWRAEAVGSPVSLSFLALQESDSQARSPVGFHIDWDSLDHCQHPRPPWGLATAAFALGSSHACFLCLVHPLPTVWSLLSRGFHIISPLVLAPHQPWLLSPEAANSDFAAWCHEAVGAGPERCWVGQRCPFAQGGGHGHTSSAIHHLPAQPASYISSYQDTLSWVHSHSHSWRCITPFQPGLKRNVLLPRLMVTPALQKRSQPQSPVSSGLHSTSSGCGFCFPNHGLTPQFNHHHYIMYKQYS